MLPSANGATFAQIFAQSLVLSMLAVSNNATLDVLLTPCQSCITLLLNRTYLHFT